MKKLLTVVFTMLLAGSLAFAQDTTGGTTKGKTTPPAKESGKKANKTSKAHKGGKKGKKGTGGGTGAPAPK
jgi:hypothetical protein